MPVSSIFRPGLKRRELGENARQRAQAYAWPKVADRLLATFGEMVPLRRAAGAGC
jgi:hypothetical protein